ncbi:DNA methyltransferase [Tropicimonas sp. IMCC6043]|uniref:DNA methyltransferase n=1 Tax=Tropicimonas sp. IMCC6043 TaxID=2510645 RepID=UPI00101D9D30|nr:DNA methyltransferase [Tropicimonas sp. IMCC6043]RYH09099.1 site-specific DNA-methyltransferase [Tropicimonas sp. IMCC6043]
MNRASSLESSGHPVATADLVAEIRDFAGFGRATDVEDVDGIRYFVNEFWTSAQRKSHAIHEISYRACFKAQLPEFFIARLTRAGDTVHDPFMGRGTTPVQAALMGRRALGNDINPLSVLLTRPRLASVSLGDVMAALETIDWSGGRIGRTDLLAFYHPTTLRRLEALRAWLAARAPLGSTEVDPVADWIRMVALGRLSGHSSGFFSGRSMPPNQAVSIRSQLRINERLRQSPPKRDVARIIARKTRSLLRDGSAAAAVGSRLLTGHASRTPQIADGSVDLVVTSPPFLDIVHYAADNWLRCWFAGIDPDRVAIDMHRTEEAWTDMVASVLGEQARILRSGGHVAFEVGEVRSGRVLLERLVWRAAEGLPFERLGVMVNDQDFTKTANCWGVANGSKGTNSNRIVLLRRI